jgi:Major Facilitator Superfamily
MTAEAVAGNFESKVIRKLQWRLIPLLFLLYVVSFIDRVNIGFAALTMNKDLRISSEQFGLVAGVFFFGYILSGIPSNLMLHKIGARVWIPAILVIWGFLALMTGLAHSVQQLYLMRFLLVEAAQAAQAAARIHPDWRRRYVHLAMRRHKSIAKVAMGRRLAIRLYWMWRNGCGYSQSLECSPYAGQLGTGHGVK